MEVYAVFQKLNSKEEKSLCILFSEEYLAKDWIKKNERFRKGGTYFYERWRVHYKEVY